MKLRQCDANDSAASSAPARRLRPGARVLASKALCSCVAPLLWLCRPRRPRVGTNSLFCQGLLHRRKEPARKQTNQVIIGNSFKTVPPVHSTSHGYLPVKLRPIAKPAGQSFLPGCFPAHSIKVLIDSSSVTSLKSADSFDTL